MYRQHQSAKYYNKCIYTFCCNNFCSYILCIMFVLEIKNRALWKLRLCLERLLPRRILPTVRKKLPTCFRALRRNTIIISPRRWGKSLLVNKAAKLAMAQDSNLRICYIDLFNVRSEEHFYLLLDLAEKIARKRG